jgi:hypothetical protein
LTFDYGPPLPIPSLILLILVPVSEMLVISLRSSPRRAPSIHHVRRWTRGAAGVPRSIGW